MHKRFHSPDEALAHFGSFEWHIYGKRSDSRYGPVWFIPEPCTVTHVVPHRRVLTIRPGANPFFHLYEAMWLLAGKRDVATLAQYNKKMAEFSDDGEVFHGSYGHRWRYHFGFDQLKNIVEELRSNPESRRCVLAMWDPLADAGLAIDTKDKPCNTHCYFQVSNEELSMTVCNRSNDLVWGMLGANLVQFGFLLEYLARQAGLHMGQLHQMTNNLHVYDATFHPSTWKEVPRVRLTSQPFDVEYDDEIERIVAGDTGAYRSDFIRETLLPAFAAFKDDRIDLAGEIAAPDWRAVCTAWLQRRTDARNKS